MKSKPANVPNRPSYQDMVKNAILNLKERNGSSRQAIKKYIKSNNDLGATPDAVSSLYINRAIVAGEKNGTFSLPKGSSGRVKLAKKDATKPPAKPATSTPTKAPTKTSTKTPSTKAPSTKKSSVTKKVAAPKKSSPAKQTETKKAPPKPKANAGRARKTEPPAPAVEEKPAVVLGKTKSGRVTKSIRPVTPKVTRKTPAKKSTSKKSTPAKPSTPAKAGGTPKKSEDSSAS